MSMFAALLGLDPGDTKLIVGIEDEPDGLRVYVNARWLGVHTHVSDPDGVAELRRQWGGSQHLFGDVPDAALCDCTNDGDDE